MEVKTRIIFTDGNTYGCISVLKQSYVEFNEQETTIGNERKAFNPTQISELKEFAPTLAPICKAMWTPEVIKRWEDYQKEQQNLGA